MTVVEENWGFGTETQKALKHFIIPVVFCKLICDMFHSIQFDYARDAELVNVVRKDLAMALKALFQHGLFRVGTLQLLDKKLDTKKKMI